MKRKILLVLVILFIAIQFIPVELNQSEDISKDDFITTTNPPGEIAILLRNSCYDCHSGNTNYPWYDRIAPVSWWINEHVKHGKSELNFSEWNTYSKKRKNHKLKEISEEVEKKKMPLESYLIAHGDAELSEEQIINLKKWVDTIKEE